MHYEYVYMDVLHWHLTMQARLCTHTLLLHMHCASTPLTRRQGVSARMVCCFAVLQGLLVWNPFRSVQTDPQSLMENLVNSGQSLAGNSCPANTTNPLGGCPAGYYCPTAAQKIECPIAYFCPGTVQTFTEGQATSAGQMLAQHSHV